MTAAAFITVMVTAFMSFTMMTAFMPLAVMMAVVIAPGVGIIFQRSCGKSLCCSIRCPLNTGIEPDPGISQSHLSAHADPAADQSIHLRRLQETGQSAMPASVGIYNLFSDNIPGLNIVKLKLFGMSEMLENLSVFISDCDSH